MYIINTMEHQCTTSTWGTAKKKRVPDVLEATPKC